MNTNRIKQYFDDKLCDQYHAGLELASGRPDTNRIIDAADCGQTVENSGRDAFRPGRKEQDNAYKTRSDRCLLRIWRPQTTPGAREKNMALWPDLHTGLFKNVDKSLFWVPEPYECAGKLTIDPAVRKNKIFFLGCILAWVFINFRIIPAIAPLPIYKAEAYSKKG